MTTRALVLGGGGTVGIAWEIGVLKALSDVAIDLASADLIVGTSAGSVVGTQIAVGLPLDALLATQLAPIDETQAQDRSLIVDPQVAQAISKKIATAHEAPPELLAEIGVPAMSAPTAEEEAYLQRFKLLQELPWPERRLLITAVETGGGEFVAWDRTSGASLQRAVASSCAVPGIFPPVAINGRRYMDGGMRSGTNADLAKGYDAVVIVAPIGSQAEGMGPGAHRLTEREIVLLRKAGSNVEVVVPDADTLDVFGVNLMDTTRRIEAAQAGLRQGEAAAAAVRAVWNV